MQDIAHLQDDPGCKACKLDVHARALKCTTCMVYGCVLRSHASTRFVSRQVTVCTFCKTAEGIQAPCACKGIAQYSMTGAGLLDHAVDMQVSTQVAEQLPYLLVW
jgi:hypothetical protein